MFRLFPRLTRRPDRPDRPSDPVRSVAAAGLGVEPLEGRSLFSAATDAVLVHPDLTVTPAATASAVPGYSPAQIAHAYGFDQVSFNAGAIKGDGTGQTIAIVDAFNDPNVAADLKV